MQYYRIYVRLKRGGQATGRDLHNGPLPDHGTQLDVPLTTGRTIKARISRFNRAGSFRRGRTVSLVTDVFADEV
jgi:hypothetical protein